MNKREKAEPSFFKWIRAARAEIARDTEGMTAEQHSAYIRTKAAESRIEREYRNSPIGMGKLKAKSKTKTKMAAKN